MHVTDWYTGTNKKIDAYFASFLMIVFSISIFFADDNCFNFDCSIKKPTLFLPSRPPQKIWLHLLLNADHFWIYFFASVLYHHHLSSVGFQAPFTQICTKYN